jgi:hypothetical protein
MDIVKGLEYFAIGHIAREENSTTNALAQQASGYDVQRGRFGVKSRPAPCDFLAIPEGGSESVDVHVQMEGDWRKVLIDYINNPSSCHDRKIKRQALKYNITDGDLYHRIVDDMMLKCLSKAEARIAMGKVHEGMCRSH